MEDGGSEVEMEEGVDRVERGGRWEGWGWRGDGVERKVIPSPSSRDGKRETFM